mgnify:CR=1 FL=1
MRSQPIKLNLKFHELDPHRQKVAKEHVREYLEYCLSNTNNSVFIVDEQFIDNNMYWMWFDQMGKLFGQTFNVSKIYEGGKL